MYSYRLQKLGLDAHIKFVVADGLVHTYTDNPVVFIAGYVPPKAAILERIRSHRPNAIVAVRNADGIFALLYEQLSESELIKVTKSKLLLRSNTNESVKHATAFLAL